MIQEFIRPEGVQEAMELIAEDRQAAFFAGGTCINHARCPQEVSRAISLEALGLDHITCTDTTVSIGATVTLQQLIDSPLIPRSLQQAAAGLYSRNVRNMATIGGNIAAGWKHALLTPVLAALEAQLLTGNGESIPILAYEGSSKLLITAVVLKTDQRYCSSSIYRRSSGSAPKVQVAVSCRNDMTDPLVVISGLHATVRSLKEIGQVYTAARSSSEPVPLILDALDTLDPIDEDIHCSRDFLRYTSARLIAEGIRSCAGGAR